MKSIIVIATALVALGSFSQTGYAASPFLVTHAAVESNGGRAQHKVAMVKSVTIAESLVQMRLCHMNEQSGKSLSGIEQNHPTGLNPQNPMESFDFELSQFQIVD